MKKSFTKNQLLAIIISLFTSQFLFAQEPIVIKVPGDYAHVVQALNLGVKNNENVPAGAEVIINVAEGDFSNNEIYFTEMTKVVKVTVKGAGADKTILGPNQERRWMHFAANTPEGVEFTIEDVTLRGFGYKSSGLGGGVINMAAPGLSFTFRNVNFENISSGRGTIVQAFRDNQNVTFENCFITGSKIIDVAGQVTGGLIYKAGSGNVTIKNTTFMSNKYDVMRLVGEDFVDHGLRRGSVIDVALEENQTLFFTLEDNVFINNRVVDEGSQEFVNPAIAFRLFEDANLFASIDNNIMIENRRPDAVNDIDLLIQNPEKGVILASNNLANKLMSLIIIPGAGEGDPATLEFSKLQLDGFLANEAYTYTHPGIEFEMDGELPKLFTDEYGIYYVVYSGDGTGDIVMVSSITISSDSEAVMEGSTLQLTASILPEDASIKSVTWSVDNESVATIDANGLLTAIAAGSVKVTATATDGSNIFGEKIIEVTTSGTFTTQLNKNRINIYPNPSSGNFNIVLPENSFNVEYNVFNIVGALLKSGRVNDDFNIDLTSMQKGIYFLKINLEKPEIFRLVVR